MERLLPPNKEIEESSLWWQIWQARRIRQGKIDIEKPKEPVVIYGNKHE
ncbi:MAG: hypothetical protein KCHDKBKB_00613 [Elusimicrobia bacterium]|nr:hypothetical protein [Elusimicrobiota bacterium]